MHAARRLAAEFGDDPGKIMLKVDFSNAFNQVDRTEMLAQVYEKLPGLYRWVEYCYSDSAHLFFGTCLLLSAAGVQQGDPLGPLLFSLVLHPLALKIQKEFPNLLLNVWYLDDGCIVGDIADVHAVFQLVQAEGPGSWASPEREEERDLVAFQGEWWYPFLALQSAPRSSRLPSLQELR